jgi:hypothetical protein
VAHSHAHAAGEGEGNYFIDQLFTILLCAGLGLVAVLMYRSNMLERILVPMFYVPVLIGGIAILAMTVIRAVAVWKMAGARNVPAATPVDEHKDCRHEHSHGDDCGHDHGHDHSHSHSHSHAHSHSHGDEHAHASEHVEEEAHDHGWAPWKYMVLAVPVFLYFLGQPREGISGVDDKISTGRLEQNNKRLALAMLAGGPGFRKTEPRRLTLRFKELTDAAARPKLHDEFEGDIGVLRGQFIPLRDKREFTLLRVDRTCCVADQMLLEMRIEAPEDVRDISPQQWVRVEGIISFQKNDKGNWIPVLTLRSNEDISTNVEPTNNVNDP